MTSADPAPCIVCNEGSENTLFFICDHAGRRIPERLFGLGLPPEAMERHVAWDVGAGALTLLLAGRLGATAVLQAYSRLVIDCNRPPGHAESIVAKADGAAVPGNEALTAADAARRRAEVFDPYHRAIAEALDARAGRATIVVSVHSFTPVLGEGARPWHAGVLHDGRSPFSTRVLRDLQGRAGLVVGDNQPYALEPETDYSVPVHAQGRRLDYLELEVRQDLIADAEGQAAWADLLSEVLAAAA